MQKTKRRELKIIFTVLTVIFLIFSGSADRKAAAEIISDGCGSRGQQLSVGIDEERFYDCARKQFFWYLL